MRKIAGMFRFQACQPQLQINANHLRSQKLKTLKNAHTTRYKPRPAVIYLALNNVKHIVFSLT